MIWIILVVIVLLAGIILLSGSSSPKKQTREQFLRSLAKFVEGDLRAIEGEPDAYGIRFIFEGQSFMYEDVSDRGFARPLFRQEGVYKAYLKTKTAGHFTLSFTEEPRSTTFVRSDVIIASKIPDEPTPQETRVHVPPKLKGLNIHTNDVQRANTLLENDKVVSIFSQLKNIDARGCPSMPLRIVDGEVILEFYSSMQKNPSRAALMHHISSMENYLEKFLRIVKLLQDERS